MAFVRHLGEHLNGFGESCVCTNNRGLETKRTVLPKVMPAAVQRVPTWDAAERRRLGREAAHRHYRIYGHGEKHAVVLEEHDGGEAMAQHVFTDPEDAKAHLGKVIDEHFLTNSEGEEA